MNRTELRTKIMNTLHTALWPILVGSWLMLVVSFFLIDSPILGRFFGISWGLAGIYAGRIAIVLLWITITPGIIKRFRLGGIFQDIQIVLMKSRRRLGDLMFTFAVMHYVWHTVFGYIRANIVPQPSDFATFELFGFAALFLLVPLFITSNDASVRFLGKNWQRIHYLIYAVMWLTAFHVSLQGKMLYAVPTFTLAGLQVASWIKVWIGKVGQES